MSILRMYFSIDCLIRLTDAFGAFNYVNCGNIIRVKAGGIADQTNDRMLCTFADIGCKPLGME